MKLLSIEMHWDMHLIKSEIFLEKHIIDTGNEEMP